MSLAASGPLVGAAMLGGLAAGGALLCLLLIRFLHPVLVRYAMARPSARGLHTTPTPQGGGIAVLIAVAAVVAAGATLLRVDPGETGRLRIVLAAAAGLAALGFVDDIRPLPPLPRLAGQLFAMTLGVLALPEGTRVLPFLPAPVETAVLILGGTWFVNLTNFMDGMDWMTVVEMVPVSCTLVLLWVIGSLSPVPGLLALGLWAGLLGYAPENRPVARLFLGDVGSLPIGFLVAYALFSLAGNPGATGRGPIVAAVLLVLYYIADSGLTLIWRLRHGQRVWEPHRSHFYQVAVARGFSVPAVLRRVGVTNLALAALAFAALRGGVTVQVLAVGLGSLLVGLTLATLAQGRPPD